MYTLNNGLPPYWMQESSGKLAGAIETYINHRSEPDQPAPTFNQIILIQYYLKLWINAPCYLNSPGFESEKAALRRSVDEIDSVADINKWLDAALEIGIDPL
ncbi:hypothetical protein IQ230_13860 [Gloeocapsopsis crepidinum LEGE 06123]|uniref:Uncharacterized protein n=1 Tax=Gloeocapsopsis crepidinum LEGE 06123 TaxID=588587 RepID=A0ABR9USY3_9CHRO|nr:hypothetical protein [Gloeocapsopsis crepidinum]MBE9191412.1 hypothetical protein [Gloeocapsopsis crepidinum LEGE 06123]